MSYQNFERALELAKKCQYYFTHEPKTVDSVNRVAIILNIAFSKQNRDFYEKVGYLSFFGQEIYGIYPDGNINEHEGDSYASTLYERKELKLPVEWLPIYNFDDGYMGYLDYSQLNEDGEPPVIMAIYDGEKYVMVEKVAEDFGDFLLRLVEEQLANQ